MDYFNIHITLDNLEDLVRASTSAKTRNIYIPMKEDIEKMFDEVMIKTLRDMDRFCWVPIREAGKKKDKYYMKKLKPDEAIRLIEPSIIADLNTVYAIIKLNYPDEIVKRVIKVDLVKEIADLSETFGGIRNTL